MTDHLIEAARSGRSKCRECKKTILKGELRLGVALPQEHSGHSTMWFHLHCGASVRFDELEEALLDTALDVPDRDALQAKLDASRAAAPKRTYPCIDTLEDPYRCVHCEGWTFPNCHRVVTTHQIQVGGAELTREASVHINCAEAFFSDAGAIDRAKANSPWLTAEDERWIGEYLK